MVSKLIPLLLIAALSGCASQNTKQSVASYGAGIADDKLDSTLWYLCNAATVGSIKREFGTSLSRADLYKSMCEGEKGANVVH